MSKNDRLDDAIDRAVRELLDVEPRAGLRGRVLDRIENPGTRGWSWIWIAAPVAAAAVVVLAVLIPWRSETGTQPPALRAAADIRLPVEAPARPPVAEAPRPAPPTRVAARRPRTPAPGLVAAADAGIEDTNFTGVDPLGGPASIAVAQLAQPQPPVMRSIEPAPLQISPLVVNALPETPRERREE